MSDSKKKNNNVSFEPPLTEKVHSEENESLENLAVAFIDFLQEEKLKNLDPVDIYTHAIQTKIYDHSVPFPARFMNGYELLVKQLSKYI
jgi:hypothetical protein